MSEAQPESQPSPPPPNPLEAIEANSVRPLPQLPPEPESPPPPGEQSPADRALAAQGGEIIPVLEQPAKTPTVLPVAAGDPASAKTVDLPGAKPVVGPAAPVAPPESPEQLAWRRETAQRIDAELNLYYACVESVDRMVSHYMSRQPGDSADIGTSMFEAGKRTPLELAAPNIALEVYRQIRRDQRDEEKRESDDALTMLSKALDKVPRGRKRRF